MVTAVFVKDPVGWNYEFASPPGMVGRDLGKRGRALTAMAKTQVGKKTTRLMQSIGWQYSTGPRGLQVTVGSDNRIALLHHTGSRAHPIVARRAPVLRFVQNGRVRYAKRVFHPGTKPNRYLTDNLPKVMMM